MIKVFYSNAETDQLRVLYSKIGESLERIKAGRKSREVGSDYSGPERVLLIVPAQFTLEAEEAAFQYLGGDGFFDLQIMSNNKLAKDIIRFTGGMGRTPINSLGRAMLLRRIAKQRSDELSIFKSVANDRSFIEMAGDFVLQLKQNNVLTSDLELINEQFKENRILSGKLRDMKLLAEDYAAAMEGKYNDAEDLRAFVTERVKDCSFVTDSEIWFYDFYSFTARDLEFLGELAAYCHGLNISLLTDFEDEAYAASLRTFKSFKAMAKSRNIPFEAVDCNLPDFLRKTAPEKHVVRCGSPFSMAETIASRILSLVRSGKCEYGEIAVLTGDNAALSSTLRRTLELYEIPVFADEKRSVSHSPAVELLSSFLAICVDGYSAANVLRLLKTGLTDFAGTDLINDFENYLKQYHINSDRFKNEFKYGAKAIGQEKFEELEKLRRNLLSVVEPLKTAFCEADDVNGKTAALESFMKNMKLEETLSARAKELAEINLLDASEQLAQIIEVIHGVLDQFCELLGSESISDDEYREILENSFRDIKIGLLPQAEGKVILGNITRSRTRAVKALFVAGFNDGLIPRGIQSDGILTDYEISQLEDRGFVLSKSSEKLMAEDKLVITRAMKIPADYLWLGYCLSDNDGQAMSISGALTEYMEKEGLKEEDDIENSSDALELIQSPAATIRRLSVKMRSAVSGYELADEWKAAYNVLRSENDARLEALESGLFFDKRMTALGRDKASDLYNLADTAVFSPSRIEKFASCPFKHFISYGLRPDEQREFEIGAIEMGTVYHEVLERFCRTLSQPCKAKNISLSDPDSPWMNVSDSQVKDIISDAMKKAEKDSLDGLLSYGKPQQYRSSRVKKICTRFADQLVRQVRMGQIDDMHFETAFGQGKTFPAVKIDTSFGSVRIEGKIDRVDSLKVAGQEYIKIIDYKSGSKTFNKEAAESGLAVQLFVYLEGALGGKAGSKPAGVFYSLIEDPSDEAALDAIDADLTANVIAEHFAKKYRLNGMLVNDESIIRSIDPDALTGSGGTILAIRKTKENELKPNTGTELAAAEEFDQFRSSVRQAVADICERLAGGEIAAMPQRSAPNGPLPCEYCDYRSICLRE